MIPALLQSGYWHAEQMVLLPQGKAIPTVQSTFLIRDENGDPFRIAVVISDITERRRAEEHLQQSHDELQAIYDGMFDGLLVVDVKSKRYVKANTSICRMLGYSEAELLSMTTKDIHPVEEVPLALKRIQARAEGRLVGHVETRMLRKDGSILYADVVGSRLVYGGRRCVVSFFRDITKRKRAEEALKRERRTLKQMLHASDHERQLIAYEIHDGLAQQLAVAIMQFEIYDQFKDSQPDKAKKAYDGGVTLLRQGHAEARRLISGVRPPILDESGVLAAIAHLVHDPAFDRGPRVHFRSRVTFKRLAPLIENVIYRIVQEGLANARTHSKSKEILVHLVQRGDRLRIEIQDWGVGFDPRKVEGNHFGLAGIRERVRLLGGKYRIKSKPDEGTLVSVDVPLVDMHVVK